jgi:putative oxidoreductase
MYLAERLNPGQGPPPTMGIWFVGLVAVASGLWMLIGFLTPAAAGLIALGSAALALLDFPGPSPNLLEDPLTSILLGIVAAAIVLLGPGRWSLDAYLWGRREIIIPQASRPLD